MTLDTHFTTVITYIEKGLSLELVEARVEEAQGRQALEQALIIDERQHTPDHRGGRLEE